MKDHFADFTRDPELTPTVREFVSETMAATGMAKPASRLEKLLATQAKVAIEEALPAPDAAADGLPSFEKADARAMAMVITKVGHVLYERIRPDECFRLAWSKEGKEDNSPNVLAVSARFNDISLWVVHEVLSKTGRLPAAWMGWLWWWLICGWLICCVGLGWSSDAPLSLLASPPPFDPSTRRAV